MNHTKVLLLFGGESSEHDVSIMSAQNVYEAMDKEKYQVSLTYIDRTGKWWLLDAWPESIQEHGGREVAAVPGSSRITVLAENKMIPIDLAFPVMHGENGHEDGAIQGVMKMAHIRVLGSGIGASAVCWDKLYTKQILERNNIRVTPYTIYRRGRPLPDYNKIVPNGQELFIKPTTAGSSIGVSKVHTIDEFEPAITLALKTSDTVLIERAITGRELEVGVIGNPSLYRTTGVGEIIPGEEFYSYEDKYAPDSNAEVITDAVISDELKKELQTTAREVFLTLGCKGLARVDFLVDTNNTAYVNEVNTLPGFTNISQFPKLWQQQGISYPELIDMLIADALKD